MWPSCHITGFAGLGGFNVAGALLGAIVPLLFLAALVALGALVIFLVGRRPGSARNPSLATAGATPSGREIAQARYARGEITREQYTELLGDLSAGKAGER